MNCFAERVRQDRDEGTVRRARMPEAVCPAGHQHAESAHDRGPDQRVREPAGAGVVTLAKTRPSPDPKNIVKEIERELAAQGQGSFAKWAEQSREDDVRAEDEERKAETRDDGRDGVTEQRRRCSGGTGCRHPSRRVVGGLHSDRTPRAGRCSRLRVRQSGLNQRPSAEPSASGTAR